MRKPHTYWDEGVTLVSSCTPCSPGCERCWAIAIERRFKPEFKGQVQFHPDRLARFNKKKPTVYSIWNDLFHEYVSEDFRYEAYKAMICNKQHTYLILTKREKEMAEYFSPRTCFQIPKFENIYHGLTVCNQQETEEKTELFFSVPGNKFLSLEPLLSKVIIPPWVIEKRLLSAVILGCETGAKARPMKLEWASKIADQCKAANVPLFIKALTINGKPNHNIEDWPEDLKIRQLAW